MTGILITGLSGSGKTTLGMELKRKFKNSVLLDGDILRHGINSDLGFTKLDRAENLRRAAWIARYFYNEKMLPILCFVSPYQIDRDIMSEIVPLKIVYLRCNEKECEKRCYKGIADRKFYKRLKNSRMRYEAPENADLILDTDKLSIKECINKILEIL